MTQQQPTTPIASTGSAANAAAATRKQKRNAKRRLNIRVKMAYAKRAADADKTPPTAPTPTAATSHFRHAPPKPRHAPATGKKVVGPRKGPIALKKVKAVAKVPALDAGTIECHYGTDGVVTPTEIACVRVDGELVEQIHCVVENGKWLRKKE